MTHEPELLTDERTAQVLVTAFLIEMRLLNDGCSSEKEFCVEAMKLVSLIENISKGARSVPQCWIDMFEDPALRLKQGENT